MRGKSFYALGRLKRGEMNKTEVLYNEFLKQSVLNGNILWYKFECMKFRLADNTFYTPDFAIMKNDFTLEMHEVKGFWQDDAKVKIKVAADLYPFPFIAIKAIAKKHGGGWERQEF